MDGGYEDVLSDNGHPEVVDRVDVLLEDHGGVANVMEQLQLLLPEDARLPPLVLGGRERLVHDVAVAARVDERPGPVGVVGDEGHGDPETDVLGDPELKCLPVGHLVPRRVVDPEGVEGMPQAGERLVGLGGREQAMAVLGDGRVHLGGLRAPPPDGMEVGQVERSASHFEDEAPPAAAVVAHGDVRALRKRERSRISLRRPSADSSPATAAACSSAAPATMRTAMAELLSRR